MKKILTILLLLFTIVLSAQTETNDIYKKSDCINKSKDEIFLDTKKYIINNWKHEKNIVYCDEKNRDSIVVKGIYKTYFKFNVLCEYTITYTFFVTFKFQDFKYNILIDNICCKDNVNVYIKYGCSGISNPNDSYLIKVQENKNRCLQPIVDEYVKYITKKENTIVTSL